MKSILISKITSVPRFLKFVVVLRLVLIDPGRIFIKQNDMSESES